MATKTEQDALLKEKFVETADRLKDHYPIKEVTKRMYGTANRGVAAKYSDKCRGERGITRAEVMLIQLLWNYHETFGSLNMITVPDGVNMLFSDQPVERSGVDGEQLRKGSD